MKYKTMLLQFALVSSAWPGNIQQLIRKTSPTHFSAGGPACSPCWQSFSTQRRWSLS